MLKRNVSKSISQYSKLLLYKSTIIPQLLYASECYSLSRMDVRALEALQQENHQMDVLFRFLQGQIISPTNFAFDIFHGDERKYSVIGYCYTQK